MHFTPKPMDYIASAILNVMHSIIDHHIALSVITQAAAIAASPEAFDAACSAGIELQEAVQRHQDA